MTRRQKQGVDRYLEEDTVREFEIVRGQVQTFYDEVSVLSKKSPDGKVNRFKLGFINGTLRRATALLGDAYRPFADFESFNDEELPSSSDVGMMLSQYLNSMQRYKRDHTFRDPVLKWLWRTKSGVEICAD